MNIDGLMWKDQRKFVHERLRSFGMKSFGPGRKQMENRIMVCIYLFFIHNQSEHFVIISIVKFVHKKY